MEEKSDKTGELVAAMYCLAPIGRLQSEEVGEEWIGYLALEGRWH